MTAVVMLITACSSRNKNSKSESERDKMKLSSDVMNVRTTTYKAQDSFGNLEKTEMVSDELIVFDVDGNLSEQYLLDNNGNPTFKAWREKK
jgi:hypothetical protein